MSILSLPSIIALIFILILFGTQIIKRSFLEKNLKKIFWVPIAGVFSLSIIFSIIQYNIWTEHRLIQINLEQEGVGLNAFLFNVLMNHFAPYLLSLLLAGILFILMSWINKRSDGKFFEQEEMLIAFLAGFLAGFPGFIFFLLGIVVAYLVTHLSFAVVKKTIKSGVVPLYYFWLPVSAFVILTSMIWFSEFEFWKLLSV